MVLPVSGLITLSDIQTEFGGTNPIALNEYYRGGANVPSNSYTNAIPTSGVITMSNFYGATNIFELTISANRTQTDVGALLTANGWNGVSYPYITIANGVYVYSTSTSLAALYNVPAASITNNGFIMGMGGAGNSNAGGPAISIAGNLSLVNNSTGYIGGGGGGGAQGRSGNWSGGGGGAGGGAGGPSQDGTGGGAGGGPGLSGSNGSNTGGGSGPVGGFGGTAGGGGGDWDDDAGDEDRRTGGGGGGRIFPGAQSGFPNVGGNGYIRGTNGGGAGQAGEATTGNNGVGAGGGGWGAAGGNNNLTSGGAAGKAIALNGFSCTPTGTTAQIYGAVS